MRFLVLLMLLGSCAPHAVRPSDLPDDPPECVGDDDCTVTRFAGCCACPGEARVMSRAELARQEQPCAVVDCIAPTCSPAPPASLQARCDRHRCVVAR